jgi:hypothetical protein
MEPFYAAANCDQVPTVEEWTKWMHEAPADQAAGLLRHAHSCLAQNVKEQRWGELLTIAERILRERNILQP